MAVTTYRCDFCRRDVLRGAFPLKGKLACGRCANCRPEAPPRYMRNLANRYTTREADKEIAV